MCFDWCFFQTLILENHQAILFQTCFFQTLISNDWFLVLMAMGIQTTFHGHRAASQPRSTPWSLPRWLYANPWRGWGEAPSLDAVHGDGVFLESNPPKDRNINRNVYILLYIYYYIYYYIYILLYIHIYGGFLKWGIPESPWVSILTWSNDLDDLADSRKPWETSICTPTAILMNDSPSFWEQLYMFVAVLAAVERQLWFLRSLRFPNASGPHVLQFLAWKPSNFKGNIRTGLPGHEML